MSFPYAVVQFPKEGTYSEIPTSWLTKDCTQCRWPTTKNATFFIKKNSPPEADWLLFDVKVECYCETLEKARKKAEDSNYATSCDEIRGRGKRIVHEKHFHDTYDASDDNTDDDSEKLVNICVETLEYVRSIDKRLNALERGNINVENEPIFDDILPINSIQNLKKFEESMETAETRSNFVEFMKKIGGKSTKNIVQRCMSRLFTNNFGIACSWYGRRNNYRMCDLKCICILKSVLRAKGIDECDFETTASEWFRLSKLRYGRENKKILPDDEPDAHNTVET
ncbi:uncharacterized protein [Temnothorax nylanderi]|uniref:uncharacterized protein n=1 Tax=Temnothorax nylanderi TaxID=102681 RepID=UPI003A85571A